MKFRAAWYFLTVTGLISSPFILSSSLPTPKGQANGNRLRRRNGQIPMWHGIPGGGQQPDATELLAHTRILQADKSSLTPAESTLPQIKIINEPGSITETPISLATYQAPGNPPLRFVTNSGVCERRPGVQTYSGYIPINRNQSMFFWLFEARKNPQNAPLVLWLNGGPGSSSMIGLFQENGPCRIKLDSSGLEDNLYSWTETANMLYIDQPIGVGYSYGSTTVKTSLEAAIAVYNALQLFYSHPTFRKFVGRDFAIWTESYGGHYGPAMTDYFLSMNQNVSKTGNFIIPVKVLGIGNGLTSPLAQYPEFMNYAKTNPYKQLVPDNVIANATNLYYQAGGCRDLITQCQTTLDTMACCNAQAFCNNNVLGALHGPSDLYDVRALDPDPYPPVLMPLLSQEGFQKAIGAETNWTESSDEVYENFFETGDWMTNSLPLLEKIINSGVRTLIYDGDADYILNYKGVEAMVESLNTTFTRQYRQQTFNNWTVDGTAAGVYKNAGSFSYLRVFGAGHEVPAYGFDALDRGRAALLFFQQVMGGQPISSSGIPVSKQTVQIQSEQSSTSSQYNYFATSSFS